MALDSTEANVDSWNESEVLQWIFPGEIAVDLRELDNRLVETSPFNWVRSVCSELGSARSVLEPEVLPGIRRLRLIMAMVMATTSQALPDPDPWSRRQPQVTSRVRQRSIPELS